VVGSCVEQFSTTPESDNAFFAAQNPFDKQGEILFLMPLLGMKTTFTKQLMQHAPVNGYMAIWTRVSCHFGSVGRKF